ncbi:GNAT family N-acetyltransferase [Paenibacillus sp. Z6-24]
MMTSASSPLDLTISPCLSEELPAVCTLLAHSFGDIFGSLVRLDEQQLVTLLMQTWAPYALAANRTQIAARADGQMVGVIGLQWYAGSQAVYSALPHFGSLSRQYGFWNMCRFAAGMSALEHTPRPGEGYIEHIATAAAYRGRGIARSLLQWTRQHMSAYDWNHLTLHVSYNNDNAINLYEKEGFQNISSHSSWTRLLLHEPGWHYMGWKPDQP